MKGFKFLCRASMLALVFAAPAASAQDEGQAIKSLLGSIGIIPKEKPPIVYKERAPLVVPPKMELPPPSSSGNIEARVQNWPNDPDVAARRKAAAEAQLPFTNTEFYKNSRGARLSVEEMRAGRNPDNYVKGQPDPADWYSDRKTVMTPDELRAFSKESKAELSGDGLERRYLSDPPGELLKAANGAPLKASVDPMPLGDPDSPAAFIREQSRR